jgi:2-polyprenyl-3-methyl-5-hydroxy-6-metoxy-1,4-benzoquinol methylase
MNDVNKIKLSYFKLKKNDKILDVGCSYGEQAFMIARQGLNVTGIDLSSKLINKLNKLAKLEKLKVKGIKGDIKKMPFEKNRFDGAVATEILEHVPNPEHALQEINRVLKRKGILCLSVPTRYSELIFKKLHPHWVQNSGHINIFSKNDLLSMLKKSGFKLKDIEYHNFEWSVFWLIHSFLKTDFDDTGSPKENHKISKIYFRIWNYLYKLRLAKFILHVGNKILPKSIYIYAVKN